MKCVKLKIKRFLKYQRLRIPYMHTFQGHITLSKPWKIRPPSAQSFTIKSYLEIGKWYATSK